MNILIRSDSSSTIGTGHIMRDLVLAQQFKDANIIFATKELVGNINNKIIESNYALEILKTNNLNEIVELIAKYSTDMIIIDNYSIDYDYEKELKNKCDINIFVLDDTYEKHHCDILLNHNVYGEKSKYKGLVPENCELLCGPKFTLLRKEFIQEKNTKQNKTKSPSLSCLVAIGGTDHSNINIKILKALGTLPKIQVNVVTTTANKNLTQLEKYVNNNKNVQLHINTLNMAKLMNQVDFAIATPSVTINEIIFMELPFIAIKTAENQREMYEYLFNKNYAIFDCFNEKKLIRTILNKQFRNHNEKTR